MSSVSVTVTVQVTVTVSMTASVIKGVGVIFGDCVTPGFIYFHQNNL